MKKSNKFNSKVNYLLLWSLRKCLHLSCFSWQMFVAAFEEESKISMGIRQRRQLHWRRVSEKQVYEVILKLALEELVAKVDKEIAAMNERAVLLKSVFNGERHYFAFCANIARYKLIHTCVIFPKVNWIQMFPFRRKFSSSKSLHFNFIALGKLLHFFKTLFSNRFYFLLFLKCSEFLK